MDKVDRLVEGWVRERLIPGGVLGVAVNNRLQYQKAYGAYSDGQREVGIRLDTIFDLASLTKVVSTLPAVLSLAAAGKLNVDDKVKSHIPEFAHEDVTIRHLLMHSSGLPADLNTEPRSARGRRVWDDVLRQPLIAVPGTEVVYSDVGMILLGEIVSRAAGEPLDAYVRQAIFNPLGMDETGFNPPASLKGRIAPTELVDGVYVHGEVHDEKCFHLGGVSGSAGLFGTAADLMKYARFWLEPEKTGIVPQPLMRAAVAEPFQARGLGWEVCEPDRIPASCGTRWTPGSFGHTGFTGTSLWIDPSRDLIAVFLTNAVHFGRSNPIRKLRRELHDEIFAALFD